MQITIQIDTHSHLVFYLMFQLWNGYDDSILTEGYFQTLIEYFQNGVHSPYSRNRLSFRHHPLQYLGIGLEETHAHGPS